MARTDGATLTDVHGIDEGRRIFTVDGMTVEPVAFDAELAFDRGALATAAFLVGLSERMIDVAAEYARQREQYGKPIGAYQAVKHLLADALQKVEFAKPAVYRAAWSISVDEPTRALGTSRWRRRSRATPRTARAGSSMQVHGAIGYTWEADLQLWMKKAWALQRAWGDATFHRRRVADSVLGRLIRSPCASRDCPDEVVDAWPGHAVPSRSGSRSRRAARTDTPRARWGCRPAPNGAP